MLASQEICIVLSVLNMSKIIGESFQPRQVPTPIRQQENERPSRLRTQLLLEASALALANLV